MGTPRKVINDYRFEAEKALAKRKAVIAAAQRRLGDSPRVIADGGRRVIPPYYPREPIPAGDEMSPGGTKVTLAELADDVLARLALPTDFDRIIFDNNGEIVFDNDGDIVVRE